MELDKFWVFAIYGGICGGIVIADSEEGVREKLSLDRGVDITEKNCKVYPLNALNLNKDVHDLW